MSKRQVYSKTDTYFFVVQAISEKSKAVCTILIFQYILRYVDIESKIIIEKFCSKQLAGTNHSISRVRKNNRKQIRLHFFVDEEK